MLDDYKYPPELVLLKDNTYLRPSEVSYASFVANEDDENVGTVQVIFTQSTAAAVSIPGVNIKDFKRVADVANWEFNAQNTPHVE